MTRRAALATRVLGGLLLVALAGWLLSRRYEGITAAVAGQVRHAGWRESVNLLAAVRYLLPRLQDLTLDPATGLYDFRHTPQAGLDAFERGVLAYHGGDFATAVALLERDLAAEGESEQRLLWLALALMRMGEVENCLEPLRGSTHAHAGELDAGAFCSLPLRRHHTAQGPARRAARLLERLLELHQTEDADRSLYRWLLNLDLMTVGGYPGEVPPRHRVRGAFLDGFHGAEAARRQRRHRDLRFTDRARELGVLNPGTGRGVAVEDFDGDGDLDLIATGSFGGLRYLRNEAGARFVDATPGSGLERVRQPLTVAPIDYDGDGRMDLFVACQLTHYRLLANRGGGRFEDVTARSGLLDALPPGAIAASWIGAWGDVDRDGNLDLFLTSWATRMPWMRGLLARPRLDSRLFLRRNGRFQDATEAWGLARWTRDRHLVAAALGDYDADGWLDLYLAGPFAGSNALLRNDRGRRFVAGEELAWREPGFTAAFLDVDHDGRLDLFHGGFADARTAIAQTVFGASGMRAGHSAILRQRGDGRFQARPDLFDGGVGAGSMGSSYGDLDNDGCFDFYLGTGGPEPWFVLPNLMFRGERRGTACSGSMEDVSVLAGFGNLQKGHGIAFFDFDADGDQDVYSSLGGMWPGDPWVSQLFVNEGERGGSWVKVRLRGRLSNRHGLGSLLRVQARTESGETLVRSYLVDGKTGFGAGPYVAHVGLAEATAIDHVEVRWLGSDCRARYPAVIRALNVLDEEDCLAASASASGRQPLRVH